jgi:formylglycine-generating enzyme required for sulfatase activity
MPTRMPTRNPNLPPPSAQLGDTWTRPLDGMAMVYVPAPAAPFALGSGLQAPAEAYWIDKYEVSNTQYQSCLRARACQGDTPFRDDSRFNGGNNPVVGISWHDAENYSAWVGGFLPTEAEWEYAAAGEANLQHPWGNSFDGSRLNFCDINCPSDHRNANWNDGYSHTAPTTNYPDGASWVGAFNMSGNAAEWTSSLFDPAQTLRVIRGGSWVNGQSSTRATHRIQFMPEARLDYVGFRVVLPHAP